jgi:tyrosyl-tRNA synthetase
MVKYYRLSTALDVDEIDAIERDFEAGGSHPNALKRRLAREIVTLYHSPEAAEAAEAAFDRVFKEHQAPEDVPEVAVDLGDDVYLPGLLAELGLVSSSGEGRRMIDQGGVRIAGETVEARVYNLERAKVQGQIVQVGRRRFARPVAKP